MKSICLLPRIQAVAGPGSFQLKLKAELTRRGIEVHHDPRHADTGAILVIAGTRQVAEILSARRRGVRIVQRLDGINWIHRKRPSGVRYFLRAEIGNLLLAFTRRFLADFIVYQSEFTRAWWQRVYGRVGVPDSVIYNGVDLTTYHPDGNERPPESHIRIQIVEGHLKGGNEVGLEFALHFGAELANQSRRQVELVVAGDVPEAVRAAVRRGLSVNWVTYTGVIRREQVPALNRAAHAFYSAEINAPCPNSVIEAMACGTPVLAFAAGSLPELVQGNAGEVVPYGGDPWKLEPPDFPALAKAALKVLANQQHYRRGARQRAEQSFGLSEMTDRYLQALGF